MTDLEIRASQARRRYDIAKLVLETVALGMLAVVLVYLAVIATRIAAVQKDSIKRGDEIQSCTTPGEPCYERAQAQQRAAVSSINQVAIVAAACGAEHPGDVKATQTCVEKELQP